MLIWVFILNLTSNDIPSQRQSSLYNRLYYINFKSMYFGMIAIYQIVGEKTNIKFLFLFLFYFSNIKEYPWLCEILV